MLLFLLLTKFVPLLISLLTSFPCPVLTVCVHRGTLCSGLIPAEVVGEGSVTDRYTPHQTEDVIALVDACESVFDEASQVKTHFRNGHYVSVAPSDDYRRSIYGSRDNIFPRLIIRGGYDRSAFNVTLGIYRDACQNLAMLRSVTETYQSIRHTSGLRFAMDELVAQFQTLKDGWQTLENLVHGMQAAEVSMVDFLNESILSRMPMRVNVR